MSDTETDPSDPGVDHARLHGALGAFMAEFCAATNTDRSQLERQVITVELTDQGGVPSPASMVFDLSITRPSAGTFDTTEVDAAKAEFDRETAEETPGATP